ncbi:MAG: hypothetical protein QXY61_02305 [Candidatus Anstonellales archaeon]
MGVKDWAYKMLIAGLGMFGAANAYTPGDIFNIFYSGRTTADTSLVASSGGSSGSYFNIKDYSKQIEEAKKEWEKKEAEMAAQQAQQVQTSEPKPADMNKADMKKVNSRIAELKATVDPRVLEIVLPAWALSPGTRYLLQQRYGTGLTDYQYKQLLFLEEYQYAKNHKVPELCAILGINPDSVQVEEFAVAYASIATLGYGIGRPNMEKAVDIAVATMMANVDSSKWTLTLALQYLPLGIQTPQGWVSLDFPKSVISDVYRIYNRAYVDYGYQVPPVQAAKPYPGVSQQMPSGGGQQTPSQQTQQTQPPTQEQIKVQNALDRINSVINTLESGRQSEYQQKVGYYDPIINYGQMLYTIETKSSTIDIILIEANGAGLVSYYSTANGEWEACLTPEAVRVLKEKCGYKDKGNWGKNIETLNKTLQEMANKRNLSGENFDKTLAKALMEAGIYLVPEGQVLVDALNTKGKDGGVEALQKQIANYQSLQTGRKSEIDSEYDSQIRQLSELKRLVEKYKSETDPKKKEEILEQIGELEATMRVSLQPSIYEQLTGKKYEPAPEAEQEQRRIPSADEVLQELGIPGYGGQGLQDLPQPPGYTPPGSVGTFEIGVGGGTISVDSAEKILFQPSNKDYIDHPITIGEYLGTLQVPEHVVIIEGGPVKATNLGDQNDLWRKESLKIIAEKLNRGRTDIEQVINEAVKEVEKEMLKEMQEEKPEDGSRLRGRDGEFQDWRTAFFGKPTYKCDGSLKAPRPTA